MSGKGENRIFLCYAREDKEYVDEIYWKLKAVGFNPWMDKMDLRPGEEWKQVIIEEIANSRFFMPFFSEISVSKRSFVQREYKLGLETALNMPEGQIFIIPVKLDGCEIPRSFSHLHFADLSDPKQEEFEIIVETIKSELIKYENRIKEEKRSAKSQFERRGEIKKVVDLLEENAKREERIPQEEFVPEVSAFKKEFESKPYRAKYKSQERVSYRPFTQVFQEISRRNGIEINDKYEDRELLGLIRNPKLEIEIYKRSILALRDLCKSKTIKLDIEPAFIYDFLLKDLGAIIKGFDDFPQKYPNSYEMKAIKEAEKYMEKVQNELMLVYKLFDSQIEPDEIRKMNRRLEAFDNCKKYLSNALDHLG